MGEGISFLSFFFYFFIFFKFLLSSPSLLQIVSFAFDVEKTNSLLCADNNGGGWYLCEAHCIACHLCFPSWRQRRPLFES